jgi:hypothetical protein
MEKDVFKFKDFMTGENPELENRINNLIKEGLFDDDDIDGEENNSIEEDGLEEINQDFNPYKVSSEEETDDENLEFGFMDKDEFNEVDEEDYKELEDLDESKSNTEEYYKLFKDKAEEFVCDIAVEGVNNNDTEVRLIVESEDWTLMFVGEIRNGKCIIPIKKLNILNEGQTGNIKLEVNADGNLFTPWEDKFVVKVSKKVTVKLNESKSTKPKTPVKKSLGVKVNVRK